MLLVYDPLSPVLLAGPKGLKTKAYMASLLADVVKGLLSLAFMVRYIWRQVMWADTDLDIVHEGIIADANGRPFHILGIPYCQGELIPSLHADDAPQYWSLKKARLHGETNSSIEGQDIEDGIALASLEQAIPLLSWAGQARLCAPHSLLCPS